ALPRDEGDEAPVVSELGRERCDEEPRPEVHGVTGGLGERQRPEEVVRGGREDCDATGAVTDELVAPPGPDAAEIVAKCPAAVVADLLLSGRHGRAEPRVGGRDRGGRGRVEVEIDAEGASRRGAIGRELAEHGIRNGGGHMAVLTVRPRRGTSSRPMAFTNTRPF